MLDVLLPKIDDYSQLFNIGGGVDVNYFPFLVFRGKNWNIGLGPMFDMKPTHRILIY